MFARCKRLKMASSNASRDLAPMMDVMPFRDRTDLQLVRDAMRGFALRILPGTADLPVPGTNE